MITNVLQINIGKIMHPKSGQFLIHDPIKIKINKMYLFFVWYQKFFKFCHQILDLTDLSPIRNLSLVNWNILKIDKNYMYIMLYFNEIRLRRERGDISI